MYLKLLILSVLLPIIMAQVCFGFPTDGYSVPHKLIDRFEQPGTDGIAKFYNDSLKQIMFIECGTDYNPDWTWHIDTKYYSKKLYDFIVKCEPNSHFLELEFIEQPMQPTFVPLRKIKDKFISIKAKYFTTEKGFKLGLDTDEVIRIYGKPHKNRQSKGYVCYQWDYPGDESKYDSLKVNRKRLADRCYAYYIRIFFEGNKAIACELVVEEP